VHQLENVSRKARKEAKNATLKLPLRRWFILAPLREIKAAVTLLYEPD